MSMDKVCGEIQILWLLTLYQLANPKLFVLKILHIIIPPWSYRWHFSFLHGDRKGSLKGHTDGEMLKLDLQFPYKVDDWATSPWATSPTLAI